MAGYDPYEFPQIFEEWDRRIHAEDLEKVRLSVHEFIENRKNELDIEFRFLHKDGYYFWVRGRGNIVKRDNHRKPLRVVGTHADISRRKAYENKLTHIAHFDPLTGLPNRVLLADRLNLAMKQSLRRKSKLAVAFIDLDGFKEINDNHGHELGDEILVKIASRMQDTLREGDTIARLGGDEFVAVFVDLDRSESSTSLIKRILTIANTPFYIDKKMIHLSASAGVTFYPQKTEVDADQLLRQSDQSMYQAKLTGKNRFHIFDVEYDSTVRGKFENLENIKRAFINKQFILHYQPKVNMRTGELIGVEALIRWQHPTRGLVLPNQFLPSVEGHDFEISLGEWVLKTALDQISAWKDLGKNIAVSVNISAMHLQQENFTDHLRQLLVSYPQINNGLLEIEILETSALEEIDKVSGVIETCREFGVKFALDDFGTGYSSLAYFKKLHTAVLKIDRSFVRDMLHDPDDLAILHGVMGMAAAFRRYVIAEGVETVEQGELLLQLGCELAQGYGIAKPMSHDKIFGWIESWTPDPQWQNQQTFNRKDMSLLFASVDHHAWIKTVINYLNGESSNTPLIQHDKCNLGQWLCSADCDKYKHNPLFTEIESLHREIHELVNDYYKKYSNGDNHLLSTEIAQLNRLKDRLTEHLKALASQTS